MRWLRQTTEYAPPTAAPAEDTLLRVRILIEAAMKEAQYADSNAQLVARQLAADLLQMNAALSDVRTVVRELYGQAQTDAEAYLSYLAENGFPIPIAAKEQKLADTFTDSTTSQKATNPNTTEHPAEAQPQSPSPQSPSPQTVPKPAAAPTLSPSLFYPGNLISELVANSAYSALLFGERRSGTSAILRAIAYDQINKCGDTLLDFLDLHSGEWGALEGVRAEDGTPIVTDLTLSTYEDIDALRAHLAKVAAEVKRRQRTQRSDSLALTQPDLSHYLFLIDGLSEVHGALPGWSADRRSKDATLSQAASHLRFILAHGPMVNISCVATARDHSRALCDTTALGETRLLFLGRVSAGRNGGYRAIDRAVEDKELLPSPTDRTRYREAMSLVKQGAHPVVFTPNGIPRLGALRDFSSYLTVDLLSHYQTCLEGGAA